MAIWVIALFGEAPCQCFSPGGIQTTSPGRISRTGPPLACTRPTPEITYRVWPSGWVCQAVRAPGSNETRFAATRAGAGAWMIGSCSTVPVKYSFGARRVGRMPAKWISIGVRLSCWLLFLACRVARLGLGVHGIKARQRRAIVHLIDDPGFHPFLLRPLSQDGIELGLRDQH